MAGAKASEGEVFPLCEQISIAGRKEFTEKRSKA